MKLSLKSLKRSHKAYRSSEQGSSAIEAIIIVPALIMLIMFCYTFFMAFDAKSRSSKAADAVADYVSRQTNPIDQTFVDGLGELYQFLTNAKYVGVRVSAVTYATQPSGEGQYTLQWSAGHGNIDRLQDVSDIEARLPILSLGEQVVVVETNRPWTPLFDVGLNPLNFRDFLPIKPRFAPQVVFDGDFTETAETIAPDPIAPIEEDLAEVLRNIDYDEDGNVLLQEGDEGAGTPPESN